MLPSVILEHMTLSPSHIASVPAILTIGNFDGLHCGHRTLIDMTISLARSWGGRAVLITFVPHPKVFFARQDHFFIHPERIRERILNSLGLDEIIYLPFGDIYQMSPRAFFDDVLLPLEPAAIVLGDNFSFGNRKSGNIDDLRRYCSESDIALHALGRTSFENLPVSSTRIRSAIRDGRIELANHMLGAPYTLYGKVEHGAQRGRKLGFPTANIHVPDQVLPAAGVYATRVAVDGGDAWYDAMTAVTRTPSFECVETVVESHLFDFDGDLYDRSICVEFHEFIRREIVFSSKEELVSQIQSDKIAVREKLATRASNRII